MELMIFLRSIVVFIVFFTLLSSTCEAQECKDRSSRCSTYSLNVCNQTWMKVNCQKSCGLCDDSDVQEDCKDTRRDCLGHKNLGNCGFNWMKTGCKKTCGHCKETSPDRETETDDMSLTESESKVVGATTGVGTSSDVGTTPGVGVKPGAGASPGVDTCPVGCLQPDRSDDSGEKINVGYLAGIIVVVVLVVVVVFEFLLILLLYRRSKKKKPKEEEENQYDKISEKGEDPIYKNAEVEVETKT